MLIQIILFLTVLVRNNVGPTVFWAPKLNSRSDVLDKNRSNFWNLHTRISLGSTFQHFWVKLSKTIGTPLRVKYSYLWHQNKDSNLNVFVDFCPQFSDRGKYSRYPKKGQKCKTCIFCSSLLSIELVFLYTFWLGRPLESFPVKALSQTKYKTFFQLEDFWS